MEFAQVLFQYVQLKPLLLTEKVLPWLFPPSFNKGKHFRSYLYSSLPFIPNASCDWYKQKCNVKKIFKKVRLWSCTFLPHTLFFFYYDFKSSVFWVTRGVIFICLWQMFGSFVESLSSSIIINLPKHSALESRNCQLQKYDSWEVFHSENLYTTICTND